MSLITLWQNRLTIKYAKVNRITFPLDNDGIVLVTTELGVDVSKLVDKVIEIRNSLNNNVSGPTLIPGLII